MKRSVITGSGAEIPSEIVKNSDFINEQFFGEDGKPITTSSQVIIDKFVKITGIEERRYAPSQLNSSNLAASAAALAIQDSGIDPETLNLIIVAHNYGDVSYESVQVDTVPSLASRVKHRLRILNPSCIAFDVLFGCPGWILAFMQADAFFKAGLAKKALIVGTETLSRVIDMYDRDSMIFSDGAGAVVAEYRETGNEGQGVLGSVAKTYSLEEIDYINMGMSYYPDSDPAIRYIKMKGRKVYEFAMKSVPAGMKHCLEISGVTIAQLKKVFIHQANEKMDDGIIKRLYQLYGIDKPPENIMPMSIHWLGNSSVATVPTLYDLVRKHEVDGHNLNTGDVILFASVGAGMNVNVVCYRY